MLQLMIVMGVRSILVANLLQPAGVFIGEINAPVVGCLLFIGLLMVKNGDFARSVEGL
jgi:hypothetical protein